MMIRFKQGRGVHDVPVLGRVVDIPGIVEKEGVEEIIIAIPSARGKQMREIVAGCEAAHIPYKDPSRHGGTDRRAGEREGVAGCGLS